MKKSFMQLAAVAMAAAYVVSCDNTGEHKVTVSNPTDIDRANETVEIVLADLKGVAAETAVVLDEAGAQVPSQVYTDTKGVTRILFQTTLAVNGKAVYTIGNGIREEFETKAYSRYVPERLDDYAYENNLVAGRIYGPALEDPRTFGSDVWLKCTERLIIDEWFAKADYHHNYGDGMDCYKVSNTLGGGAFAPVSEEGKLVLGDNYASYIHVCDGPVRTEAVFEYPVFNVDGHAVSATRKLSLDVNSRFVKSVVTFHSDAPLKVALGAVRHDVLAIGSGANWLAFTEKASDTDDPERDGDISIALVCGGDAALSAVEDLDGHAALVISDPVDGTVTGWTGSGWSQGGVASAAAWEAEVANFAARVAQPLVVKID